MSQALWKKLTFYFIPSLHKNVLIPLLMPVMFQSKRKIL